MTKDEAKQEVQRIVSEAKVLLAGAEKLMDEHRFSVYFLEKEYCPRNITEEREAGDLPIGQYVDVGEGGVWQGSSDMC